MELLTEVAKQVPALAVLAYLVWTFLKHLKSKDEFMQRLHGECYERGKESNNCIKENTKILAEVNALLRKMNSH